MEFKRYHYSNKRFVIILILNFVAFFIWFIDIWDFSIIPFILIFTASQILISTIISIITFEIKKVTTYGNGEMRKRIVESLSKFSEYEYIDESKREGSLTEFIKNNGISILILTKLKLTKEEIKEVLDLKLSGIEVKSYSDYMLENEEKIDVEFIDEEWLLQAYGFKILHSQVQNRVKKVFDLTPRGIERALELRSGKFKYQDLAAFGHIGRTDLDLPWEKVDKVEELKKALNK